MARKVRIAKSNRRGLGKGMGKGYPNLIPKDPKVHSDSSRGIKQPQRIVSMPPPPPLYNEYEQRFADEYGVDLLKALKDNVGDIDEISFNGSAVNGYGDNVTTIQASDGSEWQMFESEEEAEKIAILGVEDDLENQPEMFNQSWLLGMADMDAVEEELKEIYEESNQSYVDDIESEDNRLIDELEDAGIIDVEEAEQAREGKFDFDLEEAKEEYVEELTKDRVDGGINGFRSEFGDEEADKILLKHIDIGEASEEAVSLDGWQHFLATYDGDSIELPNGRVLVRIN